MRLGMGLGLGNLLSGGPITGMSNKYSFNFDGSNDYLEIADNDGLDLTNFTLSAWIKLTDVSDYRGIISKRSGNAVNYSFFVTTAGANGGKLGSYDGSAEINSSATVNDGNWHHVAQVHNSGTTTFYIDGSASGSGSQSFSTNAHAVLIGETGVGQDDRLLGNIDEVAIWAYALDETTIAKMASKPSDLSKASSYVADRSSTLKLWLRAGDKVLPEEDTSIARSDFYTAFDGSSEYVDCGNDSSLQLAGDMTITGWINPTGTTSHRPLVYKRDAGGTNYQFYLSDDSTPKLKFYDGSTATASSGSLTKDRWQHIAITIDSGVTDGSIFYIDGVASGTATFTISGDDADLLIGKHATDSTYYEGDISSVGIYKTALDSQTIKQLSKSRFLPQRQAMFSVVDFDGTNPVIAMTTSSAVSPTEAITVSAWVNFTSLEDYDLVVGNTDTGSNGWRLAMDNADNIIFAINSWGSNHAETPMSSTGVWHHLVGTYDKSNIKIYLDGELKGTDAYTDSITYSSNVFQIGGASGWSNLTGSISSVAIYSDAKDADFIYAQYQKGITHNPSADTGLVGLWLMGDDTSKAYPTIADSSSNSNDGTITNGASDDIQEQMVAGYDMGSFESSSEELGVELVDADASTLKVGGTYLGSGSEENTDTYGWKKQGSNTLTNDNGALKVTGATATGAYNYFLDSYDFGSTAIVVGNTYKVEISAKVDSGDSIGLIVRDDASNHLQTQIVTNTSFQTFTYYFTASSATTNHISMSGVSASEAIYIDSWSVKQVLQSADLSDTYPALIDVANPTLGAELTSLNSVTGTGNSFTNDILTFAVNGYGFFNISGFSVSTLYKLTYTIATQTASGLAHSGGSSAFSGSIPDSVGSHTQYLLSSSSSSANLLTFRSTGFRGTITNIALKEIQGNVGTMTSMATDNLTYSSVLPDQSSLIGINSAYNYIDLDGSNEYIQLTGNSPSGSFTISAWVYDTHASGTDYSAIYASNSTAIWFGVYNNSSGKVRLHVNGDGNYADTPDGSWVSPENEWIHLSATWDGTNAKIYINGVSQTLSVTGTLANPTANANPTIGINDNNTGLNQWDGYIANVGIWNKALSELDISAIKTAGRHTNLLDSYSDNLVGYWAMGALDASTGLSDSISTIYDRSSNSNHGSPQNADAGDLKSPPNADPNGYSKGETNRSTDVK